MRCSESPPWRSRGSTGVSSCLAVAALLAQCETLECTRAAKLVKGLEGVWGAAEHFGLSSVEKRRLRGGLISPCSCSRRRRAERELLISSPWGPVAGCVGMVQSSSRKGLLEIRKHLFTERMVKHWNGLPRERVDTLSPSVFKRHLDIALKIML